MSDYIMAEIDHAIRKLANLEKDKGLTISGIIDAGLSVNCRTLAERCEVSEKTILRHIDQMKSLHDAPIKYDYAKKSYYYTEKSYKLPLISMNESDLFAIAIAEKTLKEHEGTPIYEKLRRIFFKLGRYLPEKVSLESAWVDSKISVNPGRHTNIRPDIWTDVTRALQNNRTLKIAYQKPSAVKANYRKVDPYHVVSYQGDWYLIGFCHLREEVRTFSISRIKKVKTLNDTFMIPENFDYQESWRNCFGIFKGENDIKITIRFSSESAPYVKEREWHPSQVLKENKDGSILLSLTTNHLDEIKRWVLFWGSGAEVLEPSELRELLELELKDALAAYEN